MAQQCSGCRFWLADNKSGNFDEYPSSFGWCRRLPPKVSDHMAMISIGMPGFGEQVDPETLATSNSVQRACLSPATFCTEWCGEFAPMPSAVEGR